MKIAFHDNAISELGTSIAIYDYAHYNETLLGNESIIIGSSYHPASNPTAIEHFKKRFPVFIYDSITDLPKILTREKVDILYAIKGGVIDGVSGPPGMKTVIHCTGSQRQPHGDVYATVSEFMSNMRSRGEEPVVPHMVRLPDTTGDLREKLNIPKEDTVIGRYGGMYAFDINWARDTVKDVINERNDMWFLFINTPKFVEHPRVLYLDRIYDLDEKVKFINTCDCMLHARVQGESFGCAIAEFSIKNKPVMTWTGSSERNHLNVLGKKALKYNNEKELRELLMTFKPQPDKDWNVYKDYTPERVMETFKKVFINEN